MKYKRIDKDLFINNRKKLIKEIDGVIIDVRTPAEFHSGHIKDATNINFYADDFVEKLKITRKDIPIYVYCRSGGRSSMAASKMAKLGFTRIYNLVGGIRAWNAANYITIKSTTKAFVRSYYNNKCRFNFSFNKQWVRIN